VEERVSVRGRRTCRRVWGREIAVAKEKGSGAE
jgi:hypothetical protein